MTVVYFFPTLSMVEVQTEFIETGSSNAPGRWLASRSFLQQKGFTDIFSGLTDNATPKHVQGRMRELNFPQNFLMLACMTEDPGLNEPARETLRHFAYDQSYPFHKDALQALATVEDSAREILKREEAALKAMRTETHQQIVGTTMEKQFVS